MHFANVMRTEKQNIVKLGFSRTSFRLLRIEFQSLKNVKVLVLLFLVSQEDKLYVNCCLSAYAFGFVAFLGQKVDYFVAVVALQQDFALCAAASYATFGFQFLT